MSTIHRLVPRLAAAAVGLLLLAGCTGSTSGSAGPGDLVDGVAAGTGTYTIGAGDTLSSIAERADVSLADLVAANGWSDGADHLLLPGDVIALPTGASAPAPRQSTLVTTPPAAAVPSSSAASAPRRPSCDEQSIDGAIDGNVSIDGFACDGDWAGAGVEDMTGIHYQAIFLASDEGLWIMQNWYTVCDEYALPAAVAVYCPGG